MYDITAIGELLIDFTPNGKSEQGKQTFEQNPGGAPGNVAAACARLGGKTAFIGKVGTDSFGYFLKNSLDEGGVSTDGLVFSEDVNTTLAFVHLSDDGDRSFSFYRNPGADMMLTFDDVNKGLIDSCRFFHFGSVSLTAGPTATTTLEAVGYAKKSSKIISFDVNYRAPLFPSEPAALNAIKNALPYADVLKVSSEEMTLITGETDPIIGSKALSGSASLVLVSLGAKGAFFRVGDTYGSLPTYDVKTIDTTGAGDAFFGAVLFRLRDMDIHQIRTASKEELLDIIDFANAAGSLATTKKGAIPSLPTLYDIEVCRKKVPLLR